MNYVPLWVKTDYSILTSMIKIDDYINYLIKNDIKKAGICDDNLYGAIEFYNKCLLNNIKPIIGLEISLDYTLLLYAKNYKGYQNLCNIDTLKSEKKLTLDILKQYLNDLVIIIPYEYKNILDEINLICTDVFIGYNNNEEKNSIDGNSVYVNKTLCINKDDEKYLPFLYKIGDKEYNLKDVYFNLDISSSFKKSTCYIADLCSLKIEKQSNLLPVYNSDSSFDEFNYLKELCIFGLKKRLNNKVPIKYADRLNYELDIINKMGFCNYFLVVWDYVKYAKKNNIMVGPGRGSSASSLVSYTLGITDIDPIKYNLLFERFLNPNRVTMPDIDIDFDALKRDEVIGYVVSKYGKDNVCEIITFSNLLKKQVIRDVSRQFDISSFEIDNLLKYFDDKNDLKYELNNINVKRILDDSDILKKVYDISLHLEGLKRHTSIHAAGVIISSKKLSDYIPLKMGDDGIYLSGYTMNYIEQLGLLKMDFLALKNLTVVDKIISNIDIKFNDIPLNDNETFKIFQSGDTNGVFQFESTGMKKFLTELIPNSINDLISAVALFRPGPMDNIPSYIKRKNNKEKVTYIIDDLKDILKDTYGIIIYQEQIMQIASKMAGFSYAESDELRRAMSKKKEDLLLSFKEKFIQGSINNGYSSEDAIKVYNLILKFANYGFNKAHSVSYAILGYKIAYLKVHYPVYFEKEILNNYIGLQNKTNSLINECKKLKVNFSFPSVNTSSYKYIVLDDKLVLPLSIIKSVGNLTAKDIVNERLENGLYKSYIDFIKRNYKLGKLVIRNLILSGALDEFDLNKKTMIENLSDVINYSELCSEIEEEYVLKPEIITYNEYEKEELINYEKEIFGFYLSNHPTSKYITEDSITLDKIDKYFDKNIKIILYLERKKDIETKKKDKMMFIDASDCYGNIKLVMFPKIYNEYFTVKIPGVYEVYGKVEKRFSDYQIVINSIKLLK